ncbi:hypothetical protein N8H41_22185 [Pseudomonas vlassakiae]|nr:hypothetical protein [Pseudomonas vlassakiae]MCU0126689.1 hypothetical protein [Pseudomonas vlassakiae]
MDIDKCYGQSAMSIDPVNVQGKHAPRQLCGALGDLDPHRLAQAFTAD